MTSSADDDGFNADTLHKRLDAFDDWFTEKCEEAHEVTTHEKTHSFDDDDYDSESDLDDSFAAADDDAFHHAKPNKRYSGALENMFRQTSGSAGGSLHVASINSGGSATKSRAGGASMNASMNASTNASISTSDHNNSSLYHNSFDSGMDHSGMDSSNHMGGNEAKELDRIRRLRTRKQDGSGSPSKSGAIPNRSLRGRHTARNGAFGGIANKGRSRHQRSTSVDTFEDPASNEHGHSHAHPPKQRSARGDKLSSRRRDVPRADPLGARSEHGSRAIGRRAVRRSSMSNITSVDDDAPPPPSEPAITPPPQRPPGRARRRQSLGTMSINTAPATTSHSPMMNAHLRKRGKSRDTLGTSEHRRARNTRRNGSDDTTPTHRRTARRSGSSELTKSEHGTRRLHRRTLGSNVSNSSDDHSSRRPHSSRRVDELSSSNHSIGGRRPSDQDAKSTRRPRSSRRLGHDELSGSNHSVGRRSRRAPSSDDHSKEREDRPSSSRRLHGSRRHDELSGSNHSGSKRPQSERRFVGRADEPTRKPSSQRRPVSSSDIMNNGRRNGSDELTRSEHGPAAHRVSRRRVNEPQRNMSDEARTHRHRHAERTSKQPRPTRRREGASARRERSTDNGMKRVGSGSGLKRVGSGNSMKRVGSGGGLKRVGSSSNTNGASISRAHARRQKSAQTPRRIGSANRFDNDFDEEDEANLPGKNASWDAVPKQPVRRAALDLDAL